MTLIGDVLDALAVELAGAGVPPARSLARDLIAGVLDQPRFWPTAHRETVLEPPTDRAIREAAARLKLGMPIQYAIGKAHFRHLTLRVDQRVLIPRPETELLVDIVLAAQGGGKGVVADVGTGSGAIALALAAEGDFTAIHAIDRSSDALDVARANLDAIPPDRRTRVHFHLGHLLTDQAGSLFDTVVSNPPYISSSEAAALPRLVRDWEPAEALFAAEDGMATIAELVPQAAGALQSGGLLAMEVDSRRAEVAASLVRGDGRFLEIEIRLDLTGRPRFLVARRKER